MLLGRVVTSCHCEPPLEAAPGHRGPGDACRGQEMMEKHSLTQVNSVTVPDPSQINLQFNFIDCFKRGSAYIQSHEIKTFPKLFIR